MHAHDERAALPRPEGRRYARHQPERTVLYDLVRAHAGPLLGESGAAGFGWPRFIERELARFLDCGLLCRGFARLRCGRCGDELLLAFSCKGRGLCPSCASRRMADTAAHLVDRVLPAVPVRQWVLAFPYRHRFRLARDGKLLTLVLSRFVRAVLSWQRASARREGIAAPLTGAVTAVQRFGGALNLHPHFHSLFPDGVFSLDDSARAVFHPLPAPTNGDVARILARVLRRVRPLLEPDDEEEAPAGDDAHATLQAASVPRLPGLDADPAARRTPPARPRNAAHDGFSLDASVRVHAHDRAGRERLCRYFVRPPFASHRLVREPDGRIRYRVRRKRPGSPRDVLLPPRDLLRRLVALLPPPRANTVRYHRCFAPYAKHRDAIVALAHEETVLLGVDRPPRLPRRRKARPPAPTTQRRLEWATLLRRVYELDALLCDRCGGRRVLLATIEDPDVVAKILRHLGLPTAPPPRSPARAPPQSTFDSFADPPFFAD